MAKSKWIFGPQNPQVHQDIPKLVTVPVISSADSKRIGLENFGNTCYANSVLQALYFCAPFRDLILQSPDLSISQSPSTSPPQSPPPAVPHPHPHPPPSFVSVRRKPERKPSISSSTSDIPPVIVHIAPIPKSPPTLFSALRSLFLHISTHPAERATVAPRVFIDKFREVNQDFRSTMHQDAHEFFNFLLNRIVEEIEEERKAVPGEPYRDDLSASLMTVASKTNTTSSGSNSNSGHLPRDATLVHKLFEGVLTSETRCLTCETVSSRDESFLDLSIDIEQNSSVTACLRQFSASEMLCQKNKFFCDACCDLQEAEKRMKIKKLPNVLALHLKRFKYQEDLQKSEIKLIKLSYRVAFPLELRIFNTVDDVGDADRLYNLFAIVVHIGTGPHHGHYVSLIKTLGSWLLFDDDNVSLISEHDIPRYFGDSSAGAAYVLYYQAADINLPALGLRDPTSTSATGSGSHSHPNNNSNAQPPYADPIIVPTLSSSNSTSTSTTVATSPEHIPVQPIPARPPPVLPPGLDEDSSDVSSDPSSPPSPFDPLQSHTQGEGLIDVMVKGSLDKDEDEGNRGEVRVNGYPVVDGWKPPLTTPAHTPTRSMTTLAQSGGGKAEKVEGARPVSRGGLFETIRKTPSMSVKTGLAVFSHSHGAASGSSSALPVATHSNGTDGNVEGRRSMSPISPTSPTASGSGKWDGSEGKTSPTRQQRPMTAAGGGRTGRTHSSVPLVPLRRPRTAVGNLGGDEKRRSANLSSSVSGDEAGEKERGKGKESEKEKEKEKEKRLGWFGRRKSMRIIEKVKVKEKHATLSSLDVFASGRPVEDAQHMTWFRTSMQKSRGPSAEVIDIHRNSPPVPAAAFPPSPPPPRPGHEQSSLLFPLPHPQTHVSSPRPDQERERERERDRDRDREHKHRHGPRDAHHRSHQPPHSHSHGPSPEHAQEPSHAHSLEQSTHAHVHPYAQPSQHHGHVRQPSMENGMSSAHASHGHGREHGRGHGYPTSPHRPVPPPPAPRMQMSLSTTTMPPSAYPTTRSSVSPERKKSMPSMSSSRDRDREQEREREKNRERLREVRGRVGRPSTAGATVNRNSESGSGSGDRSLPPMPPLPLPLQHGKHPSVGSVNGNGGAMLLLDGPMRESPSPTRGVVDANTGSRNSAYLHSNSMPPAPASSASSNLKRVTRKLSLTGPILGFGKKDKDKEKERGKAALSSYLTRF